MPRLVVTGSGGAVGRLMRAAWDLDPVGAPPLWLSRRALRAGAAHGARTIRAADGVPREASGACVLVLAGGREADNAAIARAQVDAALRDGAARVLVASSVAVYGGARDADEAAPRRPGDAYGRSKAEMEDAVLAMGGPVTALRLANVVGADSLAGPLSDGEATLDRMGGRGPVRSYLGAAALLAAARALAAAEDLPAVLNVAQDPPLAMGDLLRAAGVRIAWRERPGGTPVATCATGALRRIVALRAADPAAMIAQWRAQSAHLRGRAA